MNRLLAFLSLIFLSSIAVCQAPENYYQGTETLSGEELKAALYNIIKGHTEYPYTASSTDTWDIIKETDVDSTDATLVIGIYSDFRMDAQAEYNSGQGWTREHVWAKSRGDFGTDKGAGTDLHHLRAEDNSTNTARNNRNFSTGSIQYVDQSGQYNGATGSYTSTTEWVWEPRDEVKGDVARMMFYMATRYEGENGEPDLELTDELLSNTDNRPKHCCLTRLLAWHKADPVDNFERRRNNIIYSYQNNRNPFIDHPEFIGFIWGGEEPEPTGIFDLPQTVLVKLYPNPLSAGQRLRVENIQPGEYQIIILDLKGQGQQVATNSQHLEKHLNNQIQDLSSGVYAITVVSDQAYQVIKLAITNE
jgi:endonuclease I